MDHDTKVELPEGFLSDMKDLSSSTVKCYLAIKELADKRRALGLLDENGYVKINFSYDYLKDEFGISKPTTRKALLELATRGWICGFERGHYTSSKSAIGVSSEYLIPFVRTISQETYYKMSLWNREDKAEMVSEKA